MSDLVAIVGDATSVAGFGPLGLAVYAIDDPALARDVWPELVSGRYGVVFVTEQVYAAVADLAAESADRPVPAVTVIPGAGSPGGVGREKLERAIVRALGTTVPYRNEES